ncbi:hypothetical protein [Micromonospora sp. KC721]|uniref:hypothetical protein n=1 Tax=Micromonospora sp. KC721 TaxID=2530380 RepID=UPI001404AE5A|nr:hypothetical protein [Micromonospora sp. KC721]
MAKRDMKLNAALAEAMRKDSRADAKKFPKTDTRTQAAIEKGRAQGRIKPHWLGEN